MTRVAVLGMGAMGSRIASRIRAAGHDLVVWSRSGDTHGLAAAPTPRDAARDADVVLSLVTDDRASRDVWLAPTTGAVFGLRRDAIAIEASTISPSHATELRAAVAHERGLGPRNLTALVELYRRA